MKTALQRYTWQDALSEYLTLGLITQAEYATANRFAHVILWEPKDGRPSGLYWDDELAASVMGISRTTMYERRKPLVEKGFFIRKKGNLLPSLPPTYDATHKAFEARKDELIEDFYREKSENSDSQSEHSDSKSENPDSQSENSDQYSGDSFTGKSCRGDSFSDAPKAQAPAGAVAPKGGSSTPSNNKEVMPSTLPNNEVAGFKDADERAESPRIRTEGMSEDYWQQVEKNMAEIGSGRIMNTNMNGEW